MNWNRKHNLNCTVFLIHLRAWLQERLWNADGFIYFFPIQNAQPPHEYLIGISKTFNCNPIQSIPPPSISVFLFSYRHCRHSVWLPIPGVLWFPFSLHLSLSLLSGEKKAWLIYHASCASRWAMARQRTPCNICFGWKFVQRSFFRIILLLVFLFYCDC